MCTVIPGSHAHGSATSATETAFGMLVLGAGCAAVAVIGAVMQQSIELAGVAVLVGWLTYGAHKALRRRERTAAGCRCHERAEPAPLVVEAPQRYRGELYIQTPDGRRELGSGDIPGQYASGEDAARELIEAYKARHAIPPSGQLCARVEPVKSIGGAK